MQRDAASDRRSQDQDWWWIFDPRLSLRARAAFIFGGSAIAFTVVFSWLAGEIFRRALQHQLGGAYETMAFQVADKLDRAIYERYRELQVAASLAPFRSSEVSAAERRRLLESFQNSAREFAWIGFADSKGTVTAATRGVFEGSPVDMRPWFRIGRERPYAGNLAELPALAQTIRDAGESQSMRFLDLAVPVMAEDGRSLGVLAAHLSWDWAREIQLSVVPESARRERLGVTVYSQNGEVLLDSGGSGWTQPPDVPAISDPRRFRGSFVENTSLGTTYLTGFARSRGQREYRGLGWFITVRQPLDLALAPARELQQRVAGWGFVFAVTLVIAAWLGAGATARRLRTIRLAANRIRTGDVLTVMPRPRGESEMDNLCHALGDMVDELRAKQEQLSTENARLQARAASGEKTPTPPA